MYDDDIYGELYEENFRFYYHCKYCSTSFSGSDEISVSIKADDHEINCELNPGGK